MPRRPKMKIIDDFYFDKVFGKNRGIHYQTEKNGVKTERFRAFKLMTFRRKK